jgi:ubiquinone/menaquinone biosynthesis C-methylase UbiE
VPASVTSVAGVAPTPSPNIWRHPEVYERLNRASDPDGMMLAALDRLLAGRRPGGVVDVGCGTGYHLPALAARADRVVGVEPHPGLLGHARTRVRRTRLCDRVEVVPGTAQRLPLEDRSVDVVFSHWAYFFGPGCEPGLAEADRVLRPGGWQVVVDLDTTSGHGYASWFAESSPAVRADRVAAFFDGHGFTQRQLPVVWRFASRADLAAVLRIEFPAPVADRALAQTAGTTIAVPTVLRARRRVVSRSCVVASA